MAGSIFFSGDIWSSRSYAMYYVMEYLISRLPDGPERNKLQEYVDNHVLMLDLKDMDKAHLVDFIADDLPKHVHALEDLTLRDNLTSLLSDLFEYARQQQAYNAQRCG